MYNNDISLLRQERMNKNAGALFICLWIMTVLFYIQEPLLKGSSLGVVIWVPSVAGLLVFSLLSVESFSVKDFLILFFALAQLIICCVSIQIWRYKSIVFPMFRYVTLLVSVITCSYIRVGKKTFDFIYVCAVIIAVLLLIYSFTPIATRYDASKYSVYNYVPDYFVYNFSNPNAAAFFILGVYCVLLVNLPYRKHRLLLAALLIACVWMIFRTECRSCLIVAIAVAIVFLFFSNSYVPNWFAVICIFLPLFFAALYMLLYLAMDGKEIMFLGKSLFSGREDVYESFLSLINTPMNALFGNFRAARLNNAHNAPLTIFSSFGLYGLVCFYLVMVPVVLRIKMQQKSRITTASVCCILGFFVTSCSEAMVFLGTFPCIIFLNSFILMANFSEPLPEEQHPEIVNMVNDSKVLQRVVKKKDGEKE